MEYLGFSPCKADADIWMRKAKRADNSDYWEYFLLYVDDCLAILENPESIVRDEIGKYFLMKEASIGVPDVYLRGKCWKVKPIVLLAVSMSKDQIFDNRSGVTPLVLVDTAPIF